MIIGINTSFSLVNRSANPEVKWLVSPNMIFWKLDNIYTAPRIIETPATAAIHGLYWNIPTKRRNSPGKPPVNGSAMLLKSKMINVTVKKGATFLIPPKEDSSSVLVLSNRTIPQH
jgi:hypothetical protein